MSVGASRNILSYEETCDLFIKLGQGDITARDKLVSSNIRLVWKIARSYSNRGIDVEDLAQEGSMGLMKATEKFDYKRGFKFSTYATWWIKQAMGRYITNNGPAIRIPAHVVGLSMRIRRATEEFKQEFGSEPMISELAELVGASEDHVKSALESRATEYKPQALDTGTGDVVSNLKNDSGENVRIGQTPASTIGTPFDMFADAELRKLIRQVLSQLTDREERVIRLRFGISEDPGNHGDFPITEDELKELQRRIDNKFDGTPNKVEESHDHA